MWSCKCITSATLDGLTGTGVSNAAICFFVCAFYEHFLRSSSIHLPNSKFIGNYFFQHFFIISTIEIINIKSTVIHQYYRLDCITSIELRSRIRRNNWQFNEYDEFAHTLQRFGLWLRRITSCSYIRWLPLNFFSFSTSINRQVKWGTVRQNYWIFGFFCDFPLFSIRFKACLIKRDIKFYRKLLHFNNCSFRLLEKIWKKSNAYYTHYMWCICAISQCVDIEE